MPKVLLLIFFSMVWLASVHGNGPRSSYSSPCCEHFYASVLVGETTNFASKKKLGLQSGSVRGNAFAWGMNAGMRFSPFLGIEVAYLKIADLRVRAICKGEHGSIEHKFPSFGLRLFAPFYHNCFDLSLLGGTGFFQQKASSEIRKSTTKNYLRKGKEEHFRPYFDLKLEYNGFRFFSMGFGVQYILAHRTSSEVLFPHFSLKLTF